jgi:lysosomal alpha-mannosidase
MLLWLALCIVAIGRCVVVRDERRMQELQQSHRAAPGAAGAAAAAAVGGEHLTIHVIAHTHDDVGWLKTVDEYYYGANSSIQDAGVQYILDSVVPALEANARRRFIYVEIAFFSRWWREQTPAMQARVRALVASQQLEFVNGGWCMNDEAATHYEATIEQMALGHEFLLDTFGVVPRIGWHIDPFGHSKTQAALFAHMGFDAFFFARIDYQDYLARNSTARLETVWRASASEQAGGQSDIFTHMLYDTTYCYAPGFAFEWQDPPIQADPTLEGVNVDERARDFVAQMRHRRKAYRTSDVLTTFGCDFQFENANVNFKNMDLLMDYINARPNVFNVTVIYSTPSTYIDAVHSHQLTWDVKTDDYFPYADFEHAYWTGYFTSRPAIKGFERRSNALLHAANHAAAAVHRPPTAAAELRSALAIAQHHDAVSGTEKQHVADDYAKRLARGSVGAYATLGAALGSLIGALNASAPPPLFSFCPLLNVSQCAPIGAAVGSVLPVVLFNALGQSRSTYARLPLFGSKPNVNVLAPDGSPVAAQLLPNDDGAHFTLVFPVVVPAVGYATYFVDLTNQAVAAPPTTSKSTVEVFDRRQPFTGAAPAAGNVSIENGNLRLTFDVTTNLLASVRDLKTNQTLPLRQNFHYYNGSAGNNADAQASGAYIFRPNQTALFSVCTGAACSGQDTPVQLVVRRGPWVAEVRQVWGGSSGDAWVAQTWRLYAGDNQVELVADVGPIPIADGRGKEVITRFSSAAIASKSLLYTDAQGCEMQQRQRNYRPTWHLHVNEPVAGNYYPKNSAAYIEDGRTRLTVVTDRSSGVASLADGELENMLHRRLLHDDGRGVGEPLNETEPIRAVSKLIVADPTVSSRRQRAAALELDHPLEYAFGQPVSSASVWLASYLTTYTALANNLPPNVHLLTFRKLSAASSLSKYLVRLHHVFAVGEDAQLAQPVTVDLAALFSSLTPVSLVELTVSANQPVRAAFSFRFRVDRPVCFSFPPSWPTSTAKFGARWAERRRARCRRRNQPQTSKSFSRRCRSARLPSQCSEVYRKMFDFIIVSRNVG